MHLNHFLIFKHVFFSEGEHISPAAGNHIFHQSGVPGIRLQFFPIMSDALLRHVQFIILRFLPPPLTSYKPHFILRMKTLIYGTFLNRLRKFSFQPQLNFNIITHRISTLQIIVFLFFKSIYQLAFTWLIISLRQSTFFI